MIPVPSSTRVWLASGVTEPAALVGVDVRRRAVAHQGLLQRVRTEAHIQRVRQPPSQHVAACPVHDRHRVEEAAAHRDESNVGAPDEVRPFDRQATQQIMPDPVLKVRGAQ